MKNFKNFDFLSAAHCSHRYMGMTAHRIKHSRMLWHTDVGICLESDPGMSETSPAHWCAMRDLTACFASLSGFLLGLLRSPSDRSLFKAPPEPFTTFAPSRVQVPPILCAHNKTGDVRDFPGPLVRDEGLEPPRSPARS